MYQNNIAVQWENGEYEGFSGFSFSGNFQAQNAAIRKVLEKANFEPRNILKFKIINRVEYNALPASVKADLIGDWKISEKSLTC